MRGASRVRTSRSMAASCETRGCCNVVSRPRVFCDYCWSKLSENTRVELFDSYPKHNHRWYRALNQARKELELELD